MNSSIYHWSLRPESGLILDLRITAESAPIAQRELCRFLAEHDGSAWPVEGVARESILAPHVPVTTSPAAGGALRLKRGA